MPRQPSRRTAIWAVSIAVVLGGAVGVVLRLPREGPRAAKPLRVSLFVDPAQVVQRSRLRFSYDPPEALSALRREEGLDDVVAGAESDGEAWRRLMEWTSAQWTYGRPDPYPPPDARIILRDIRSGFTGGFCAQYCFVLVQAIQSFGVPARLVTITGHEVAEAWLPDEGRWVMLDPSYRLQVTDLRDRTLNALEIRRAVEGGEPLTFTAGHRAPSSVEEYAARFLSFAVWLRDDFVSRPMNFADFDRYRVWFDPPADAALSPRSLRTDLAEDLYGEPVGWAAELSP